LNPVALFGLAVAAGLLKLAAEPLVLSRRLAGTGAPTPPRPWSPKLEGDGDPSTDVATGAAGAPFAALIGMGSVLPARAADPTLLATLEGLTREAAKSRAGGDALLVRLARWERRTKAADGEKGVVGEEGGGGGETIYFLSRIGGERASSERRGDLSRGRGGGERASSERRGVGSRGGGDRVSIDVRGEAPALDWS
jgi:hypothetical protein